MPDNKLTDNEIIKALECCKNGTLNDCDGCPCFCDEDINTARECAENLMSNALDLINRLQAENRNLNAEVEKQKKKVEMRNFFIEKQKAENEMLKKEVYRKALL